MTPNEDLLALIYELINRRDLTAEQAHLVVEKLEIQGCCESRIEFERRILVRFREASAEGGCCPDRLKKKILSLMEEL
jgi:hypothetical protein